MIEESRPCRPEQNLSVDRESMPLISRGHKGHVLGSLLGRAQGRIGHERHHTLGLTGQAQHRHCSMGCKIKRMQPVTRPQQKIGHHRRPFQSQDRRSPIAIMIKLQVQDLWHRQQHQNTDGLLLFGHCIMASRDPSTEVIQEQDRLWPVGAGRNLRMIKSCLT